MSSRTWKDEDLIKAVKESNTYQDVAHKLGLANHGANSKTIKKYILILNLNTSHFLTQSEILRKARNSHPQLSNDQIFCINSIDRGTVKKILIRDSIIPYKCSECNIVEWNGKKLSLHLDHINGINNDNCLSNLRFLCPNCHSQTSTYCGKQLRGIKYSVITTCIDCNIKITKNSIRCRSCAALHRNKTKIIWIPTKEIILMVSKLGYVGTGKKLGVSDNAVKKRIRNHPND